MARKRILLITPGDPGGIGPEIVAKVFSRGLRRRYPGFRFVCVGSAPALARASGARIRRISPEELNDELDSDFPGKTIPVIAAPEKTRSRSLAGYQSGWSIEKSVGLILSGKAHGLVTGPISKKNLNLGGYHYQGHTDFLEKLCRSKRAIMMLANDQLRVSLVTIHVALKDVPKAVTAGKIRKTVEQTIHALTHDFGIRHPSIAVAALNPHAGEAGLFGQEEARIIAPEVRRLRRRFSRRCANRCTIHGPLPADTLFASGPRYDAVICMYHDQGLIPVKLLDFRRTVNVTLGLPLVRTSVDHGTAFDIAGKGQADPTSLESAIQLAVALVKNRLK